LEITTAIGLAWIVTALTLRQTIKLAGIAQTVEFQQLISDPTRITANSKTLIDLAFTNKPELINGAITSAASLRSLPGILSCPADLDVLIVESNLYTLVNN
jgi:hypothetical protein